MIVNKRKLAKLLIVSILLLANLVSAQSFTGTGGIIPDNGNSVDYFINVTGLPNAIDTTNFGVETVCINAVHSYDADLEFYLVAPDGTQIGLTLGNGGGGDNYTNTCFNYYAQTYITQGNAPFTGTFKPQGHLGNVNNGQNPNGVWKLHIMDTYPFADSGTLVNWNITFGTAPAKALFIKETNIPLVILKTNGQSITGNNKIMARMGIIDNGPGAINHTTDAYNAYNGFVGIKIRGSSSSSFPQKQYSVETRDSQSNNLNVSLLGMAADNDWILYAPYTDKTCLRNKLTYVLSNEMNRWAIKGRYCEVILNGEYQGIYELTETIKQGKNRLNIAKMTVKDTLGDSLTGGYIVKIDRVSGPSWVSNYLPDQTNIGNNQVTYQCIYPKPDNILPVQFNYIKNYVDSFETALAATTFADPLIGWRKYADENAFIDYFLLNELTKNVDAYTLSTFFFKDKNSNGGKLQMGPDFDYNLAWHNANYCTGDASDGWIFRKNDSCNTDIPFWWKKMLLDKEYANHMKCRWLDWRATVLDITHIFNKMDSIALYLNEATERHFKQWPILGTYVWPNPSPIANTYAQEIANMKLWITKRLAWMDNNVPGVCANLSAQSITNANQFKVYPNPVDETLKIDMQNFDRNALSITIYDAVGKIILSKNYNAATNTTNTISINVNEIKAGFYFVKICNINGCIGFEKIMKL